jgi:Family of unknown function (DUF5313)
MQPPGPLRWLKYAFGGALPSQYSEWIQYDSTCATWWARHTARFLVQLSPLIAIVLIFLPGPVGLRVGCAAIGVAASVALSFGWVTESVDRRMVRAGYPSGLAERLRERRSQDAQRVAAAARRARIAARHNS